MKKKLINLPAIDPAMLAQFAREAVLAMASEPGGGASKHNRAVDMAVSTLDDAFKWPKNPFGAVAEALDGHIVRLIIGGIVKHAYAALKSDGLV